MHNDFISYDLERKRNAYQSQEKEICKDCKDRVGLPCLFVFDCDKLKEFAGEKPQCATLKSRL